MKPSISTFTVRGETRLLRDPDGPPTPRQLARLNRLGLLEFRDRPTRPLSKGEAAYAIDAAKRKAA